MYGLITVPAHSLTRAKKRYLRVIRAANARGALVLSVHCGAFALAQSNSLDRRQAGTHLMRTD